MIRKVDKLGEVEKMIRKVDKLGEVERLRKVDKLGEVERLRKVEKIKVIKLTSLFKSYDEEMEENVYQPIVKKDGTK